MNITREMLEYSVDNSVKLAEKVSAKKYQTETEQSLADVLARVYSTIQNFIGNTGHSSYSIKDIHDILIPGRFIPGGSILAGLGITDMKCSLSNCYVIPIKEDSIEGIMEAIKEASKTFSYRGGVGIDLSILRPKGAKVSNAARTSSGAVSFMPLFSTVTSTIGQNGRRGAFMLSLDIRHPDALDFIWCKADPERVFKRDELTGSLPDITGANISLKIPDSFMEAVASDSLWEMYYPDYPDFNGDYDLLPPDVKKNYNKTIPAKELLHQIAEAAHSCGDPGVLFINTVHDNNPGGTLSTMLRALSTNPCGEQPLAAYNNCLLGALVLSKYVENPWSSQSYFNMRMFEADVKTATDILSIVSDINCTKHPLQDQIDADTFSKRIGLEITGLADMLAMLGLRYDSQEALDFAEIVMSKIKENIILRSTQLAEVYGACKAFETGNKQAFLSHPYITSLPESIEDRIKTYGIRNSGFLTAGPTGSISIVSGNCSTGIEPVYALVSTTTNRITEGKPVYMVHPPLARHLLSTDFKEATLEDLKQKYYYVDSHDVNIPVRIKMQATLQKYIDSSISSTINLPESATVEYVQYIYTTAHQQGLKGITIFRDGCKQGVLSTVTEDYKTNLDIEEMSDCEEARRFRVHWKGAKMYIVVTLKNGRPLEVFVALPREAGVASNGLYVDQLYQENRSLWDTITRLASLLLRSGASLGKVIKQLDKATYSLVDAAAILSRILSTFNTDTGVNTEHKGDVCPECKEFSCYKIEGCMTCTICGYTKCF